MRNFCISAIQMVSGSDVAENLAQARALTEEAAGAGAHLVLLPEYFAHLAEGGSRAVAEPFTRNAAASEHRHPIQWNLQNWARELDIWIAAGAMPLQDRPDGHPVEGQRTRSAFLLYDQQGVLRARYDKMHLFDVEVDDAAGRYRESNSIEPGDAPCVVSTPWAKLGLSICFDLRFPELYRQLAINGAEVLMVPAAFTHTTGQAHWKTLLQARAIENGCFVIAANQGGQHSEKRRTWGHSVIIDPWGEILAEAGEGEAVITATLDASKLEKVRKNMPVLSMRRL
ncbi:carbon-nitrogen hydrolase family protein [uncultured Microbulbifer sp.]|uniref:carbon-nitrogen hydrolase family protein n=1 Tax=uncultured Microbulbifer sp. TaxID=348147 RepID=UPI00262283C6|nr:carbon-nitrogen hydrolase family protein [uncultured Microbulbifer sp.]